MPVWGASTSLLSNAKMNSIVEGQKSGIELERRDKTSVISDGDGGMLTSELPKASLQGCSEAPSISAPQANLRGLRCEDADAFFRPLSRSLLWNQAAAVALMSPASLSAGH